MNPDTYERLQGLLDQIMGHLSWEKGPDNYERAFAPAREMLRNRETAPVKFVESSAKDICPSYAHEHIQAENLLKFDNAEKFRSLLLGIPEERAPAVEHFFKGILRTLQGLRFALGLFAKLLPGPNVGRPPKMPCADECRAICLEIRRLITTCGVSRVDAQKQVQRSKLNKQKMKLRMIQGIWAEREVYDVFLEK
jgi:hypothetical protein